MMTSDRLGNTPFLLKPLANELLNLPWGLDPSNTLISSESGLYSKLEVVLLLRSPRDSAMFLLELEKLICVMRCQVFNNVYLMLI